MNEIKCNKCGKEILCKNMKEEKGFVLKSRLVFINEDMTITGVCGRCKNIIKIPIAYKQKKMGDS